MIVRLSHPWKWHLVRDVLDTEAGDLTDAEARRLIHGGIAVDVDTILAPVGGGVFEVQLRAGPRRVRGRARAILALKEDANQ